MRPVADQPGPWFKMGRSLHEQAQGAAQGGKQEEKKRNRAHARCRSRRRYRMKMSAWHGQTREVNPKKAQLGRKIAHRCILMGCFMGISWAVEPLHLQV